MCDRSKNRAWLSELNARGRGLVEPLLVLFDLVQGENDDEFLDFLIGEEGDVLFDTFGPNGETIFHLLIRDIPAPSGVARLGIYTGLTAMGVTLPPTIDLSRIPVYKSNIIDKLHSIFMRPKSEFGERENAFIRKLKTKMVKGVPLLAYRRCTANGDRETILELARKSPSTVSNISSVRTFIRVLEKLSELVNSSDSTATTAAISSATDADPEEDDYGYRDDGYEELARSSRSSVSSLTDDNSFRQEIPQEEEEERVDESKLTNAERALFLLTKYFGHLNLDTEANLEGFITHTSIIPKFEKDIMLTILENAKDLNRLVNALPRPHLRITVYNTVDDFEEEYNIWLKRAKAIGDVNTEVVKLIKQEIISILKYCNAVTPSSRLGRFGMRVKNATRKLWGRGRKRIKARRTIHKGRRTRRRIHKLK
jgi:hypothetical protein